VSGGRPFSRVKFEAMVDFWVAQRPDFDGGAVAWSLMQCDFLAYRLGGVSITGATYLKGDRHPEVAEVGIGYFERAVLRRRPLHLRLAGYGIAAAVVIGALRR